MKQLLISTVGDLKKALADIPDDIILQSFGPDSGGYDYESGDNVALLFNNNELIIGHDGSENEVFIWSDNGNKIIGKLFCHQIFSTSTSGIITLEKANELVAKNPELFKVKLLKNS